MEKHADAQDFVPWFAKKVVPSKPPPSPQVTPQAKPAAPPPVASHLNTEAPVFIPGQKPAAAAATKNGNAKPKYNPDAQTFVPMAALSLAPPATASTMTTKTVPSNSAWSKGAPVAKEKEKVANVAPLVEAPAKKVEAPPKKEAKTSNGSSKPANNNKPSSKPVSKTTSPQMKPRVPPTPPNTPQVAPTLADRAGVTSLPTHSDKEAKEISDKSNLSAAATVFIPRALMPAAPAPPLNQQDVESSPPPRPVVEPAHPSGALVLDHTWQLFYNDFSPSQTVQFDPCLVYRIDTLETFWRTMNNVPTVTNLPIGSTFFLFRDGIDPKWEDEANKAGGSWSIRFHTQREKPDTIDEVWQLLCARLVGESWEDRFNDTVNGLVAKVRDRYITLQVWVTEKHVDFPHDILSCCEEVFPAFAADYVAHEEMHQLAQQKEQAAAANNKKKRKH